MLYTAKYSIALIETKIKYKKKKVAERNDQTKRHFLLLKGLTFTFIISQPEQLCKWLYPFKKSKWYCGD